MTSPSRHCAYCLIPISGAEVKLCGKCGRRAYCSRHCQTLDWSRKPRGGINEGQRGQGHKHWCGLTCGEEDLDWVVTPVEGKGLGLVALKRIPARSRIIVEAGQRSPHSHPATKDLYHHPSPKGSRENDPDNLKRKWDLNSLGCGPGDDETSVLCLRIARVNHDCNPNAMHIYDNTFKVKILFAERDISPGEEICFAYQSFKSPSAPTRHLSDRTLICGNMLRSIWGIKCPPNCVCHSASLAKLAKRAVELDDSIMKRSSGGQVEVALRGVKQLLTLHQGPLASSFLDMRRTLYDGFQVGIMKRRTLHLGMAYLAQVTELMGDILHPKSGHILGYQGYQRAPQKHRNYLIVDIFAD